MMAPQEPSRILNVARHKPLIGIPADRRILGPHPFHCVGEKYIAAVADAADATPVLIPSLGERNLDDLLSFSTMTLEETRGAAVALFAMMHHVDGNHLKRLKGLCT